MCLHLIDSFWECRCCTVGDKTKLLKLEIMGNVMGFISFDWVILLEKCIWENICYLEGLVGVQD